MNFKIITKTKSFDLAVAADGCYNYLVAEKKEFVLNKSMFWNNKNFVKKKNRLIL